VSKQTFGQIYHKQLLGLRMDTNTGIRNRMTKSVWNRGMFFTNDQMMRQVVRQIHRLYLQSMAEIASD